MLRESEQQSLLAVTTTIAGSLKGRQELLFRADSLPGSTGKNARDITPVVLAGAPLIDGRAEEWDTDARNLVRVVGPGGDGLRLLAATHERRLFLALLVRDNKWVFDASGLAPLDLETIGDRVWLAFDDKRGGQQRLFFGSTGPGSVRGRRIETLTTAGSRRSKSRVSKGCGSALPTAGCWKSAYRCPWSASTSACSSTTVIGAARHAPATARSRHLIFVPRAG